MSTPNNDLIARARALVCTRAEEIANLGTDDLILLARQLEKEAAPDRIEGLGCFPTNRTRATLVALCDALEEARKCKPTEEVLDAERERDSLHTALSYEQIARGRAEGARDMWRERAERAEAEAAHTQTLLSAETAAHRVSEERLRTLQLSSVVQRYQAAVEVAEAMGKLIEGTSLRDAWGCLRNRRDFEEAERAIARYRALSENQKEET